MVKTSSYGTRHQVMEQYSLFRLKEI